jgi:hypothetical protein
LLHRDGIVPKPPSDELLAEWHALSPDEQESEFAQGSALAKRAVRWDGQCHDEDGNQLFEEDIFGNGAEAITVDDTTIHDAERAAIECARSSIPELTEDVISDAILGALLYELAKPQRPAKGPDRRRLAESSALRLQAGLLEIETTTSRRRVKAAWGVLSACDVGPVSGSSDVEDQIDNMERRIRRAEGEAEKERAAATGAARVVRTIRVLTDSEPGSDTRHHEPHTTTRDFAPLDTRPRSKARGRGNWY